MNFAIFWPEREKTLKLRGVIQTILIFAFVPVWLIAGGRDHALFISNGKRFDIYSTEELPKNIIGLSPLLAQACGGESSNLCINWKLGLKSPSMEANIQPIVSSAMQLWRMEYDSGEGGVQPAAPFEFTYEGVLDSNELPFEMIGEEIALDSFGNEILSGDFVISMDPPQDVLSYFQDKPSEYVFSKQYLVPHLSLKTADISWAGIFINPAYLPEPYGNCQNTPVCIRMTGSGNLSLKAILVSEIGRKFLGLSTSTLSKSLLYPVQNPKISKSYIEPQAEDRIWLDEIYGLESFNTPTSWIEGQIRSGTDASSWTGATVFAIPDSEIESFSTSSDAALAVSAAVTDESGKFKIKLPPGQYVLFAESLISDRFPISSFDEATQVFGRNLVFQEDFYDGEGRESNIEPSQYSPRSIFYSALVTSVVDKKTTGVEFYTNEPAAPKVYLAEGSSNELLSNFEFGDLTESLTASLALDMAWSSGSASGCSLKDGGSSSGIAFIFVLLGYLALCRRSLVRSDRKAK